jgi:hypothetical protein
MKKVLLLSMLFIASLNIASAQCDIQIQILEDRFMYGQATKLNDEPPLKKMEVSFTSEYLEVVMPINEGNYLIRVINEACQAYCSRDKRVRQLHSGDEKLVRNLFKAKEQNILGQIRACES